MRRSCLLLLCALLELTLTLALADAHAATISWDTDADGDWATAINWNPAIVPGPTDDAVIDRAGSNGAPPTVTHSIGTTTIQSLLNNEAVAVTSGSTLTTGDFTAGAGARLQASTGGSFTATGTVAIDQSNLNAQSGGLIDVSSLASYAAAGSNASWTADGSSGGTASRIDATGMTNLTGATSFARSLLIDATNGGEIDLGSVTTLGDSNVRFLASGAGSLVDVSSLESFLDSGSGFGSILEATDGGEVRLRNDAAANIQIDGYRLTRNGASSVLDTSRVTALANSTVQAIGAGATFDLGALGSFDTNSFEALAGGSLTVGTTSYSAAGGNNSVRNWTADGGGTIDGSSITSLTGATSFGRGLAIEARDVGQIDLQNVTSVNDSNVAFEAEGAGSLVDLSSLESFVDSGSGFQSNLTARDGGEVRLRSDLAANLQLDGYRLLRDGAASTLDTSRITSLVNSTAQASGAGTTLDLTGLTSFDTNSYETFAGADLTLATASYSAAGGDNGNRRFTADGASSRVDASAIANLTGGTVFGRALTVKASTGGEVDLANLTTLTDSNVAFIAQDAVSLVDISSLQTLTDLGSGFQSKLEARDGGELRLPGDAASSIQIDGYAITREGASSTLDTSRVTSLINSTAQVIGPGTTLDLTSLASFDTNSFLAIDGAHLTIGTTSYSAAGGDDGNRRFLADDTDGALTPTPSRIDGSSLTSLTGGLIFGRALQVEAQDGGEVDLQNVTSLTNSNTGFLARGAGSLVDISSLQGFADQAPGFVSHLEARDGGEVRLRNDAAANLSIDSYRVTRNQASSVLDTRRVTNLTNSTVQAIGLGTTLDLTGLSSFDTNSFEATSGANLTIGSATYTASGGDDGSRRFLASGSSGATPSQIDGSSLTNLAGGAQFGRFLSVDALNGGQVDLQNVTTITGQVAVLAEDPNSRVDLSSLTSFDALPAPTISRIEANGGGLVQLRPAGTTQLTNVDLFASSTGTIQGDVVEVLGGSRVVGEGTLGLNELINQAFLAPGRVLQDPGQITLPGDLMQTAAGVFNVDVGGLLATEFDRVDVLGTATLGGEIQVTLVDPEPTGPVIVFDPQVGDFFDVLTAASIVNDGIFVSTGFADSRVWLTEIFSDTGGDTLRLRVAVPEAGTFHLISAGLLAALVRARRSIAMATATPTSKSP